MNKIKIDSFSSKDLDFYVRMKDAELHHLYEPKMTGLFIAESPNVIQRALQNGYEPVSFLISEEDVEKSFLEMISRYDVPVFTARRDVLNQMTGFSLTRGALSVMKRKSLSDFQTLIKNQRRIVILENVMNPTNVGAIFRSAAALNMDSVLLTKGSADPLYRRASRVSMGTCFQIPWTFFPDRENYLETEGIDILHEMGFKIVCMALKEDSFSLDDPEILKNEKLAIIMGTESTGIKEETLEKSDYTVMIPMSHDVDSLNVAAASAVAFWELGKGNKKETSLK